ncbi:MAG: tRNA 2-thiocytidine(32) synthetase TtcA [Cycloclasticus sp. symbiont of Poecilosclerida sp. M]|nr:MAG: tRNA 2-thiocytidine(32) synthetase TtcA [Cycloclasticus sp. symbiont of Poecilosclerida sp. M]
MSFDDKNRLRFNKLQKRLRREMGQAIADYNMIEEGDRIMVCLSGGKDSYTMLDILLNLKRSAPIKFDVLAVNLDQKQPDFPEHILPEYLENLGVQYHVIEQDTYSVVKSIIPEGKTTCGLCSRMRRGALYAYAEESGYNKIALGHHRDDIIETFFLNMFHGGQLKAMPAKLKSDNDKHIVIRPLAYSREKDIAEFATLKDYPIIPCNLCGTQENLQRVQMKAMLNQWDKAFPGRVETIFNSMKNIKPSQLLDGELFDFKSLSQQIGVNKLPSEALIFPTMQVNE